MAKNELKPCQCGSDVELCRGDDDYYIYCPKCKLKHFSDRVYDNITDNCDRLIEVWNKRDVLSIKPSHQNKGRMYNNGKK